MRVLVTGSEGYVGSAVVPLLVDRGHEVCGLDTCWFERAALGGERAAIPLMRKDLREITEADLDGFDGVVHLAALSNDPLGDFDARVTEEINRHQAARLAALARRRGVPRFVFSSSCSVYGAGGDALLDEGSVCRPLTAYASSKLLAERDIAALADGDFCPVFLRHATAYGASSRMRFDLAVNNFVAWACATGTILLKSDGHAWRPLVHIEDIASALVAALEAPAASVRERIFNVGTSEENFRIRDVAALAAQTVDGAEVIFEAGADRDGRSYRVDCSRIRRELPGWSPRWTVRRGLHEVRDWCRRWPLQPSEFEGRGYNRLPHLRDLVERGILDRELRARGVP